MLLTHVLTRTATLEIMCIPYYRIAFDRNLQDEHV